MDISITDTLRDICPGAALGVLHYHVNVEPSSPELLQAFDEAIERLSGQYRLEDIVKNGHIAAARNAYKALGKSPQSYRNAAEAMLRRIVKKSGLYHINNVVEINNFISVSSGYSIGSYDASGLRGNIELRRAEDGAHYAGIGKASVNIEHLPVLYDEEGPFGNPTSDSRRAMIREGEREVYSVLYSFDGTEGLKPWMKQFADMLRRYCSVGDIDEWII